MTKRLIAVANLREMTSDELVAHLREQRGQLFQVRLQQTIGQVDNHRQIRAIRQEIARTMTIQVQLTHAAERGETTAAPTVPVTAAVDEAARRRRRLGRVRRTPAATIAKPAAVESEETEVTPVAVTAVDADLPATAVPEAGADGATDGTPVPSDETESAAHRPATDEDQP